MHKSLLIVSSLALGASLIWGQAQAQDIAALNPQGGWSVAKVDNDPSNKYCALSRQYDKGVVLTLGRNAAEEYSLAIDFQTAKFKTDKSYSLTLQPAPGKLRAYEKKPASEQALVVRLGYDDSFFKALESSGLLKAEIDNEPYHFTVDNFSAGRLDLKSCLAGIGAKPDTKLASNTAPEKPEGLPPMKVVKAVPEETEATKEDVNKAVENAAQVKAPAAPVLIEKVEEVAETASVIASPPQAIISKAPEMPVDVKSQIEIKRVDTKRLDTKLAAAPQAKTVQGETIIRSNNDALLDKANLTNVAAQKQERAQLEQLQQDNIRLAKALRDEMSKKQASGQKIDPKLQADLEKLRAENERLKSATEKLASKPEVIVETKPDPEVLKQLETLKADNAKLSQALKNQETQMASFDAHSPEAEAELAAMRAKIKAMSEENKELYADARDARSKVDSSVVEAGSQALKRIREYERKYEAAKADNMALSQEIEELRRMQEDKRLSGVAGNWDLEKSTKRYNEAEREIKRLGMLMEQQRAAHRLEKRELEEMLFDPAVTDKEQRRKLTELELKLAAAEKQLMKAGRMPVSPQVASQINGQAAGFVVKPDSIYNERIAVIPQNVPAVPVAPVVAEQRENLAIERLNKKVDRQEQQLQAYERNLQTPSVPRAPVRSTQTTALAPPTQTRAPAPSIQTRTPLQERLDVGSVSSSRAGSVSRSDVSVAVPVTPMAVAKPVLTSGAGFGQAEIQSLLQRAGVSGSGRVITQTPGKYRWNVGALTGQAQVTPAAQAGSLDQFTQGYIARLKRSCGGDFASLPSSNAGNGTSYEIACISPTRSTSSSVVFTQRGNDYVAIAHETNAEDMDLAMDARDKIAAKL